MIHNLDYIIKNDVKCSHLTKKLKHEIDVRVLSLKLDPSTLPLGAKLYILRNNLTDIPRCITCNKQLKYYPPSCSYRTFCSTKCSARSSSTQDLKRKTNLKRYGTINALNKNRKEREDNFFSNMFKEFDRFAEQIKPLFSEKGFRGATAKNAYKWRCLRCNTDFNRVFVPSLHKWPKCPQCDSQFTDIENTIAEFLKENQIAFRAHYRKLIKGFEVDFFLPDYQIAIETNGLFYHTECFFPDHCYHANKTSLCHEKGVRLIQIFSDELENNPKVCFNRLKAILGLSRKINGRECFVQEISHKTATTFLDKYHSQGRDRSSKRYGLFFRNRLVAVMTFCKLRGVLGQKHSEGCWELSRFVTLGKYSVRGGFQKLLQWFIKSEKPKQIVSYCDRRWTPDPSNSVYVHAGFKLLHTTKPNYWYTNNFQVRLHRANFQKHMLLKKYPQFSPHQTEKDIMNQLGYRRIWDAGHHKFILELQSE